MDKKITILIFTHNEEKNIKDCIDSAKVLTKNIIVVDSESSDKTTNILKEKKIKFYSFPYQLYVEPARKFGIEKVKTEWFLILDADERITYELIKEIKDKLEEKSNYTHYQIPRKNVFINRWLKHGGWWPDYQIRLINKKYFIDWPKEIHSTPKINGANGILKTPLIHLFHGDLETMVKKTTIFEEIESQMLHQAKKTVTTSTFFRKFLGEIWRRLIIKKGFLDGKIGIIEGVYQAFSKTITYLFLYEKYLSDKKRSYQKSWSL